jgi:hypothetical protein
MYDVDTLFVMRKSTWSEKSVDINEIINKYDPEHEYHPDLNMEKGRSVPGFNKDGRVRIGKLPIEDYLQGVITKILQTLDKTSKEITDAKLPPAKQKEIGELLNSMDTDFGIITDLVDLTAKNSIVHLLSTNMLDMKNRKDLLTPISFERVAAIKSKTPQELSEMLTSEDFLNELAEAGLIKYKCKTA